MQKHVLRILVVVAERHVWHVTSLPHASTDTVHPYSSTPTIKGHTVVQLAQSLLLNAHTVEEAPCVGSSGALVFWGRVALFLQSHLLRKLTHNRLRGQPGKAGDWWQMAEHKHTWCKIGVHATVAQKLIA